ncbi:MAG TPA: N-acetyl-D-Glu racemase DgcA [Phenylobacterium sp.]
MRDKARVSLALQIRAERLALKAPFRISRGVKTHADLLVAELTDGVALGRGECVPYARYGETTDSVRTQLATAGRALAGGRTLQETLGSLPPGAARNALDCAAWDLEARRGQSVAERLGRPPPAAMPTAVTISLDTPDAMHAAALTVADAPLLKVKLSADDPAARLTAVAEAAPNARLIVDPNEGWTLPILMAMAEPISRLPVALVEQPLPVGEDDGLFGLGYPAPICADESAHTAADLAQVAGRYQVVNVKLDKAGGLTEALAMTARARELGLGVLAGCMVSSSLSIAPAMWIGAIADAVDLDGPWWLVEDRDEGCRIEAGMLHPPRPGFWG